MSEIVDFASAKKAREERNHTPAVQPIGPEAPADEWGAGPCVCLGCRYEWVAVMGVGDKSINLICPSCDLPKGTPKYPFGAGEDDLILACFHCKGEALTAYIHDRRHYVRCMGCGVDLTDVFFNGD